MTDTKHTPAPWAVSKKKNRTITANGGRVAIASETPFGGRADIPLAVANAAHIVKCVNMHEELASYLMVCLDIFESEGTKERVCSDIRETLKKAGAL